MQFNNTSQHIDHQNLHTEVHPVALVGAGPGDPELLTIKALRLLQAAEVVLTDRLVSHVIVDEYTNPEAEIIYVGKQCRRGASTPQRTINELMADYALQGKKVVRLKGGDVSIFSNVLDELETLVAHNIPYEIVPGVTAALGAAAYAGIPLTARNRSTAVRFLTYYKSDVVTDAYWSELARTRDTLVFYMSAETLGRVVDQLLAHGADAATELAIVEQATTPLQKVHTSTLAHYAKELGGLQLKSPSLVIIGKVVELHRQFAWRANQGGEEEYFKPVEGKLVAYGKDAKRA
ncbi:uroporphyrinogen-III C-methyltransferase [Cnuella takakiae]|nr:uroporphyrinogen-III C-methyltransferase [Cnuella takakiae]